MWQGHWCKWTCVMLWYGKGVGESVEEKWGRGRLICGSVKSLLQIADDPSKYSDWFLLWHVWLVKLLSIVPSLPPPPASLLPTSNENESLSQWHLAWALCCALCIVSSPEVDKCILWRSCEAFTLKKEAPPASQPARLCWRWLDYSSVQLDNEWTRRMRKLIGPRGRGRWAEGKWSMVCLILLFTANCK